MSANASNAWPKEIARLFRPGKLADYIMNKGWSYGALARRTEMDGVYLSRVARDGAPVKVVLAVVKATELTPRRERSGKRGGKAPQHWVRVLQQIDPALTEAQCRARIESAEPLVGDALREIVDHIGKSYGELGNALGIDKTHVLRAVPRRTSASWRRASSMTGRGLRASRIWSGTGSRRTRSSPTSCWLQKSAELRNHSHESDTSQSSPHPHPDLFRRERGLE